MASVLLMPLTSASFCKFEQEFSLPSDGLKSGRTNGMGMASSLRVRPWGLSSARHGRSMSPRLGVVMMADSESKGHERRDSPPGASGNEAPTGVYTTTAPLPQGSETPVAERIAYICQDCGYIYAEETPFEDVPDSYDCPVCTAPKGRFVMSNTTVGDAKEDNWSQNANLN